MLQAPHSAMRGSRRVARFLLVAASRSRISSTSSHAAWTHVARLVSTHRCPSWPEPFSSWTAPRNLGAHGFASGASTSPPTKCWSCATNFTKSIDHKFFCDACGEILPVLINTNGKTNDQHVPKMFKVLGIAYEYSVDTTELESSMKALQKTLHPDKFGTKCAVAQTHSAAQASLVNRAYAVLKDPLQRAKYMLNVYGACVGEDDDDFNDDLAGKRIMNSLSNNSRNNDDISSGGTRGHLGAPGDEFTTTPYHSPVDSEVLMMAMELREAIEDAVETSDPERRAGLLRELLRDTAAREAGCLEILTDAFAPPVDLERAKKATVELAYLARAMEEIKEKE